MENDNKKKIDLDDIMLYMAGGGFLAMILMWIICSFAPVYMFPITFSLLVIAIITMIVGLIGSFILSEKNKKKQIANINLFQQEFQQEYDEYVNKMGIVKSDIQATLIELNDYDFHSSIPQYLWIDNEVLKLFPMSEYYKEWETSSNHKPDVSKLKLKSIPIDSILYFEEVGELRKYTKVSGGGTSLKGALLGYAIADDVGAIIGSREPIKSEVITEDDRRIELIYKNQNNEVENLEFEYDAYEVLKQLIPTKELRRIVALSAVVGENNRIEVDAHKPQSIKEKLNQLNDLKNEGLITDEEFSEQKKRILDTL